MRFLKQNICHQIEHSHLGLACYSLAKWRSYAMNTETFSDWTMTEAVFPASRCCQFLQRLLWSFG